MTDTRRYKYPLRSDSVAQSPLGSRPAQRGLLPCAQPSAIRECARPVQRGLLGLSSGNPPHRPHGEQALDRAGHR